LWKKLLVISVTLNIIFVLGFVIYSNYEKTKYQTALIETVNSTYDTLKVIYNRHVEFTEENYWKTKIQVNSILSNKYGISIIREDEYARDDVQKLLNPSNRIITKEYLHLLLKGKKINKPLSGDLKINSYFGWRTITLPYDENTGIGGLPLNGFHDGVDYAASYGTKVYAMMSGKVEISISDYKGYGSCIVIQHENGLKTLYAHLSKRYVGIQNVTNGQLIGLSGDSGIVTGPHLHIGLYFYTKAIDPLELFYWNQSQELRIKRVRNSTRGTRGI